MRGNTLGGARRILLVVDSLGIGGAEGHVADLASELQRRGVEVHIACASDPRGAGCITNSCPVHDLRCRPVRRGTSTEFARRIEALVHECDIDLIHSHMHAAGWATAYAAVRVGLPHVHTEHSEAAWRLPSDLTAGRRIYTGAQRIIAVSEPILQRLIALDAVPPDRVVVIPNAVPPIPQTSSFQRPRTWSHARVVGAVARLETEKGLDVLLEAIPAIVPSVPDLHVVIVGDGAERGALLGRAERLGIADRVTWTGRVAHARALLPLFDVLAVPSRSEGAPLVILEAMMAGVPVVASAVGGIPAQLRHGIEGILVPPARPDVLAAALTTVLRDSSLAQALSQAARRRVHAAFDHRVMVDRVVEQYDAALRKGPQSPRSHTPVLSPPG